MAKDLNKFGNKKITTLFSQINNLQDTLKSDNTTGLDSVSGQTLLIFNKEPNTDKAELYIADENLENIIEVGNNICKINYRINTLNLPDKINDETVNYKVGEKVLFTHFRNNVRIYTLTENDIENKKLVSSYVKAKENSIYFVLFDNSLWCYNDGWIKAISVLTAGEGINIEYRNNLNNIISLLSATDETLGGIKTGFNKKLYTNPQSNFHHLFSVLIDNDEYEKDEYGRNSEKNKNYQKAYINIPTAGTADTNTELGLESSYGLIKVGFNPDKQIIKDESYSYSYSYSYEYHYLVDPEVNPLDRNFSVQLNKKGQAFVNISKASDEKFGTVKLGFDPNGQIIEQPINEEETPERINLMGEDFDTDRVYPLRLNTLGQAFTYVPWTNTKYTLPQATDTILGGVKVSYHYTSALDNIRDVHAETDSSEMRDSHYQYHFGLQSDSTGKAFVNIPQLAYLGTKLYSVNYSNGKLTTTTDSSGSFFTEVVSASQIVTDGGGIKSLEHSHVDYITTAGAGLTKSGQTLGLNRTDIYQIGGVKVSYRYSSELDNINAYYASSEDSDEHKSDYQYHFGLQSDSTGKAFVNIPQLAYLGGKLESVNYSNGKLTTSIDQNSGSTDIVTAAKIVTDGGGIKSLAHSHTDYITSLSHSHTNYITSVGPGLIKNNQTLYLNIATSSSMGGIKVIENSGQISNWNDAIINSYFPVRTTNDGMAYIHMNNYPIIDKIGESDFTEVIDCNTLMSSSVIGCCVLKNGPIDYIEPSFGQNPGDVNHRFTVFTFTSTQHDPNGWIPVLQIALDRNEPDINSQYCRIIFPNIDGYGFINYPWHKIGGLENKIAELESRIAALESRLNS